MHENDIAASNYDEKKKQNGFRSINFVTDGIGTTGRGDAGRGGRGTGRAPSTGRANTATSVTTTETRRPTRKPKQNDKSFDLLFSSDYHLSL